MSCQFLQGLCGTYVLHQQEDNSPTKCRREAGAPGPIKQRRMNIYASLPMTLTGRWLRGAVAVPSGPRGAELWKSTSLGAVMKKVTFKQFSDISICLLALCTPCFCKETRGVQPSPVFGGGRGWGHPEWRGELSEHLHAGWLQTRVEALLTHGRSSLGNTWWFAPF